jgi:response regulator RpfG family c-di-GMP phosphodiesterase
VLQYIKGNENLKHIPVIMLTTSSAQKDIYQSYNNHANCYITKPVDANDFLSVVATIENFWISIVKLPTNEIIAKNES